MTAQGSSSFDAAIGALRRRRWLAVAVFSVVLASALSFAASLPNLYQSTATVLVEQSPAGANNEDVDSRLQRIRQEILSRTRLAELIGRMDLYPDLRRMASQEVVVARMRRDVKIDLSGSDLASNRGTIAFSLAYRGRDPKKVAEVANALTTSYIEEDSLVRGRQTSTAASALQVQLEDVKQRLAQQEGRIADFKKKYAGSLPQQSEASMLAQERVEGRIQKITEAKAAAVERREALIREGGDAGAPADPDRERLEKMRTELSELRTKFSERYPDVVQKKAEVESLAATVAAKPQVDRALPKLEQLNREIRGLQAEETRLRDESASYQRRIDGAPWLEQEYQALSRDYTSTRDFYDSLLKRYEEAQLAEGRSGNPKAHMLRLLDPAITPMEPLAPDRFRLAIFGLIAALAFGVIAVAAAERLDTSFHTVDELRTHTRVPVLVRIPQMKTAERSNGLRRAVVMTAGLVLALSATVSATRALAHDNEDIVLLLAPRGRS